MSHARLKKMCFFFAGLCCWHFIAFSQEMLVVWCPFTKSLMPRIFKTQPAMASQATFCKDHTMLSRFTTRRIQQVFSQLLFFSFPANLCFAHNYNSFVRSSHRWKDGFIKRKKFHRHVMTKTQRCRLLCAKVTLTSITTFLVFHQTTKMEQGMLPCKKNYIPRIKTYLGQSSVHRFQNMVPYSWKFEVYLSWYIWKATNKPPAILPKFWLIFVSYACHFSVILSSAPILASIFNSTFAHPFVHKHAFSLCVLLL